METFKAIYRPKEIQLELAQLSEDIKVLDKKADLLTTELVSASGSERLEVMHKVLTVQDELTASLTKLNNLKKEYQHEMLVLMN